MESFFVRYRNLLVLLVLLVAQIIGLAVQVRRIDQGRISLDRSDTSGVRLIRYWARSLVSPPERAVQSSKTGVGGLWRPNVHMPCIPPLRRKKKEFSKNPHRQLPP